MIVKPDTHHGRRPYRRSPRQAPTQPKDRTAEITKAAGELFLRHGFEGVSLEMIVARTGGSYREIYREFGGKKALFERVMQHACAEILAPLQDALSVLDSQPLGLREALALLGKSVLQTLLAPPGVAFHRLMISEAPRFPKLALAFHRTGPADAYASVAAFLSARARREQLAIEDFQIAAASFVEGLLSPLQLRVLTGGRVTRADIENHLRQVVDLFLDGAVRRP